MDVWNLIAERKIREAQQEGAFGQLDGAGQPLDLAENPFEDPSERMGHRLLRNNGFAPRWIEEGREIDGEVAQLRRLWPALDREERERLRERLNRLIRDYNLSVPVTAAQKLAVSAQEFQ